MLNPAEAKILAVLPTSLLVLLYLSIYQLESGCSDCTPPLNLEYHLLQQGHGISNSVKINQDFRVSPESWHQLEWSHPFYVNKGNLPLISDPRRGCFIVLSMFIFFLFSFFFRHDFVRPKSLEPLLAETPNSVCCLVLRSSCALLLTIQFALLFFFLFFLFFFAKILSGSYLWNCYSQGLQIECDAWFCGLVLHYCLPSNSLRYFFIFFFFLPRFCPGHISGTITRRDSKLSVLLGPAV